MIVERPLRRVPIPLVAAPNSDRPERGQSAGPRNCSSRTGSVTTTQQHKYNINGTSAWYYVDCYK